MTRPVKPAALVLILLCLAAPAAAEPDMSPVDVSGYAKAYFTFIDLNGALLGAAVCRGRLALSSSPVSGLVLRAAYDLAPRIQDPVLSTASFFSTAVPPAAYRLDDFRERLYPSDVKAAGNAAVFHNLDRLLIHWSLPRADIIAGRQPVSFGSARFINPTDVLTPFLFNELDREDRPGIDAVRVKAPIGALSEAEAGAVAGPDAEFRKSAAYARAKFPLAGTDVALLALAFRQNGLLGIDLARSFFGAGAWLEAAGVRPGLFRENASPDYFRLSLGADYGFSNNLYTAAEYHFNSAGRSDPDRYAGAFSSPAYAEGGVYLLGRHYFSLTASYPLTPLLSLSALAMLNATDGSVFLFPRLAVSVAQDVDLEAGVSAGFGDKKSAPLSFASEFGSYPDMAFSSFRIYF